MLTVSLCMIVKNEEDVIGRCLDSVKDIFDEIIVVDTGSTDRTKEIVRQYTDLLYEFEWIDDFSAARNYSFSKATKDYIMWLDADDIILPEDKKALLKLKQTLDPAVTLVMMKYNVAFDTAGNPTYSYYRERLFKRSMNYQWKDPVHEAITPHGNIIYRQIAISHKKLNQKDPQRNLRIYEKLLSQNVILSPRQQFYYARELYYQKRYEESIKTFTNFLDSDKGWVENCIDACKDLSECYAVIGKEKKAIHSLLRSMEYGPPRAEICCELGRRFMLKKDYSTAIFWYTQATSCKPNNTNGGFILPDCYNYLPYIQMCVCYDKLGDWKTAYMYNEKAAESKPEDKSVLINREYFKQLRQNMS